MDEPKYVNTTAQQVESVDNASIARNPEGTTAKQAAVQSVALADALTRDNNTSRWSSNSIQLYAILLFVTLNDTISGFDGSLMSSMNAMPKYHSYFNIGMQGSSTGIVFAIYTVGNISGSLFAAPASDRLGRRFGMFIGAFFILVGTVLEATSRHSIGQFMGGRFLIGFGVTIGSTAGPTYVVEIAPPAWRGLFGGLYHSVGFYVGAIAASWTCYGTGHMSTDWSWRIPVILQGLPAFIVFSFVWFIPESPRWLVANGKVETAHAILTKFHGGGKEDSAVVALEMSEIERETNCDIELARNRWWDYRPLFSTRARWYRVWLLLLVTVFSQFIGGSVISYYTPIILQNIGITSSNEQLLINSLNIVFSFLSAVAGSFTVDKFGRRHLFLWGTFLTGLCYVPMNVIAAQAGGNVSTGSGYAFIAFLFLYGICFSFCWTPLQSLYPAEILSNDIRAQGMAFQGLLGGLASFINTYATPVALQNIGWKTYTIFLIFHFVQLALMYFSVVETKGRSLEELDEIFDDQKPVKKSLEKHNIVLVAGHGLKMEMDV